MKEWDVDARRVEEGPPTNAFIPFLCSRGAGVWMTSMRVVLWMVVLEVAKETWSFECDSGVRPAWLEVEGGWGAPSTPYDERRLATARVCREECESEEECASFQFEFESKWCRLANGSAVVVGATSKRGGGSWSVVGQKWCPRGRLEGRSCWAVGVQRGKLLVGFAERVLDAEDLQNCADACLNSESGERGFNCVSGVFYADMGGKDNCVLNSESKDTQPTLFTTASEEERDIVAYFDLLCAPTADPDACNGNFRRVPGYYLQGFEMDSVRGLSLAKCLQRCHLGSMRLFPFRCRSVNYNHSERLCALSDRDRDQEPDFFWHGYTRNVVYADLTCAD